MYPEYLIIDETDSKELNDLFSKLHDDFKEINRLKPDISIERTSKMAMKNNTRLLIKNRATSKSTGLLYTSEATGYPIVVETEQQIKQLKEKAKEMNISIPEPIRAVDLLEDVNLRSHKPDHVLIDDGYRIIGNALKHYLGTDVIAVTLSDNVKEQKKKFKDGF